MKDWYPEVLKLRARIAELEADKRLAKQYVQNLETDLRKTKAKLEAVIHAVYDGCDCDCRGNVNKALQERDDE
jgi:hypothetical protein